VLLALAAAVALQAPGTRAIMPNPHVIAPGTPAQAIAVGQLVLHRATPTAAPRCELDCDSARQP